MEPEESMVRGLAAGDAASVRAFLLRTHDRVYLMAGRLTPDASERRDWAHETLLGVLQDVRRGRFEYRGAGSFWAWFRKRAWFRLLDEYRRTRRVTLRERPEGGAADLDAIRAATRGADPFEEVARVEMRAALEECLARLANADHRRALELLLLDELPYERIATSMGAPLNTVRAWIRRGRLAVRRCLTAALGLGPQPPGQASPSSFRRGGAP
jgi:RNA polymerase sigma-70 factor (ECF subfamily)